MSTNFTDHPYVIQNKCASTPAETEFKRLLLRHLRKYFPEYYGSVSTQVPFKHPRGFYIVDFYIGPLKLAFEIDGGYHWGSSQLDKDLARDHFLNTEHFILVKHIANEDVLVNGPGKRRMVSDIILLISKRIARAKKHEVATQEPRQKARSRYHTNRLGAIMSNYTWA